MKLYRDQRAVGVGERNAQDQHGADFLRHAVVEHPDFLPLQLDSAGDAPDKGREGDRPLAQFMLRSSR